VIHIAPNSPGYSFDTLKSGLMTNPLASTSLAGLVNDRDRFYNEAQQADGNRGKIEVLNALLGYATQTKIPFTAYFGKVRYQAFVDKAEQRSKESCRYFTRFQRRYIRS
jgi:hypothetical protein